MRRNKSNFSEQQLPVQERMLASTHIVRAHKLIRVFYYQQLKQHNHKQPNASSITLQNTAYKKDMAHSQYTKLQASKTTMLHEKASGSNRPRFIQLTIKPKSFKTTKIAELTRSKAQIPNHIEVLPILPLINCGECANCEQGQIIESQSHPSISSNRSLVQAPPSMVFSQVNISKSAPLNITFSIRKKIFDDPPAMRHSLQTFSRSKNRKIFEPLNLGNRSVSLNRSTSIKKKIFGEYSIKNKCGPIKTQEDTMMSDIPSMILSQWQIQEQIHTVTKSRIPQREEENWTQTHKDEE